MPSVQEIYDQLLKDPDLEVGSNQTREQAAQSEAHYRVRQYHNNEQALALANEPLEEDKPIDALKKYLSTAQELGKSFVEGTIAVAQDVYKNQLNFFNEADYGVKFVFDLNNPKESNAYKALPKTHPLKSYIDSSLDVWKSNNEDGNIDVEHLRGLNEILSKEHNYALGTGAKFISKTQTEHMFNRLNEGHQHYKAINPSMHTEVLEKTKGLSKYLSKQPQSSEQSNQKPPSNKKNKGGGSEATQGTLDNAKLFSDNEHLIRHHYEKKHSLGPGEELENLKYNEFKENFINEHSEKNEKEIRHKVLSPLEASHRTKQKKEKDLADRNNEQNQIKEQAKKKQDANNLPHANADFKDVDEDVAQHMARNLLAHHENHKDYMTEPKKKTLESLLARAKQMGADLDALASERESIGNEFGSEEHLEDARAKHKENEDFKFAAHSNTPEAQALRNEHAAKKNSNVYQHDFDTDIHSKSWGKASKRKTMASNKYGKYKALGFKSHKSENATDDDHKFGPPNKDIIPEMQSKGYVWHEETRHWILQDTLNDMKSGVSGGGMSLAHKNHTKGGKASFLNGQGQAATTHFTASHAGIHAVDHNDITGAALHRNFQQGNHYKGFRAKKIKSIDHNTGTNILHNSGISNKFATPKPPKGVFGSIGAMSRGGTQNYKRFKTSGKLSDLFKEERSPSTALSELLKKYQNHSHRATLHAEELLDEEEKKEDSRV
jgi:hypothetical protein